MSKRLLLLGLCALSPWVFAAGNFIKVHESFTVIESIRPAISDEGDVMSAAPETLYIGNGVDIGVRELDLSSGNYQLAGSNEAQVIHLRDGREVVFLAMKEDAACGDFAGVYRRLASGREMTVLLEGCRSGGSDAPRYAIAMSPNATVAVPSVFGFVLVGNARGPLANPLEGGSIRYSTVGRIAVNNAGQIALQSETGGGRRIAFYADPNDLTRYEPIAHFSIASNPVIAINNAGTIMFSINEDFTANVDGSDRSFPPGVYLSEMLPGTSTRRLTTLASDRSDYCYFGAVTLNDAGHYAFSAQLNSSVLSRCDSASDMDGVFRGANPLEDQLVVRGQPDLESHQFFDGVTLGYLNSNSELSFITRYSEPLVSPVYVWKARLADIYSPPSLWMRILSWVKESWERLNLWLFRL